MKKFMLVTHLDMHKYEGQSSFYLVWVKEFILEQNLILFITPQRSVFKPSVWFLLIQGNMKKFLIETSLDLDKYEGWSSFNLVWVNEFILE